MLMLERKFFLLKRSVIFRIKSLCPDFYHIYTSLLQQDFFNEFDIVLYDKEKNRKRLTVLSSRVIYREYEINVMC
jgi:hypothetical protein